MNTDMEWLKTSEGDKVSDNIIIHCEASSYNPLHSEVNLPDQAANAETIIQSLSI